MNIFGVLLVLTGIVIVSLQVFLYLKDGHWESVPLFYLVSLLGPDQFLSWLYHPISWLGLHKIVNGFLRIMPLSLFLLLVGWALTVYGDKKPNS